MGGNTMKRAVPAFLIFILLMCGRAVSAQGVSQGLSGKGNVKPAILAPVELRLFVDHNGLKLSWKISPQDAGKVTGYEIVRSNSFGGPYRMLDSVNQDIHQYVDLSASPGIVYFYKVRAVAGSEYSHFSNIAGGEKPSGMP